MKKRVGYKLIAAVSCVLVCTISVFAYLIIVSYQKELVAHTERAVQQLSETVKGSTKYYMLKNNRKDLHRAIETIASQEGIERIRVINKEGRITFSSDRKEMGRLVDKNAEACYRCHAADRPLERLPMSNRMRLFSGTDGARTLGVINPIYNEPSCSTHACHEHDPAQQVLGVLDITTSLRWADEQLRGTEERLAFFAVAAILLVSFLLWVLVDRLVSRPVHELAEATKRVAEGNMHTPIRVNSADELGDLADAFNAMVGKLGDAQKQVLQSDRLASLGRLSAGVAHELNNPLTGILSFSSFLLKRVKDDAEMQSDLETIVRETKRCREIVKGLLGFARQAPSNKIKTQVNVAVEQALTILGNELQLQRIDIERRLSPDLPDLLADSGQMMQIVVNLIVNAMDAVEGKAGTIEVSTNLREEEGRNYVEFIVSDNGCGISKENVSKIFEPFFTSKGPKGTGLGLAVVWGIVENHNGRIKVESEEGRGTKFIVLLPVE